jgi:NADH-quinone oxidoreductase subunit N
MSAPILWIVLPLLLALLLWVIDNQRIVTLLACIFVFFLASAAWFLPIETALKIGSFSIKLGASINILGRQLVLTSADRPFLALIYGSVFFWFLFSLAIKVNRRQIPLGLIITALLVAAIAVTPFLYAALLIEMAVLLAVPFLAPPGQPPGKGLLRFLIFQTLAMPFILFSGWLLAGIDANPGNQALMLQAAVLLGLGFSLLLAIFPFYTWIPLLTEESSPYSVGFILWMFPTTALFFGLGFIDQYTWLRTSAGLPGLLNTVGILVVVTGGMLAAFQHHFGRLMGYAVIVEIGFSLLAIGLGNQSGLDIFFLLLIPRTLSLLIWALALTILKEKAPGLTFEEGKGRGRQSPFVAVGLVLANLCLAGIPLLASFPVHQALWEGLSRQSLLLAFWVLVGSLGLFVGAIRALSVLFQSKEGSPWQAGETWVQRILLGLGWLVLAGLGLFPQWAFQVWTKLPAMFLHLGQ